MTSRSVRAFDLASSPCLPSPTCPSCFIVPSLFPQGLGGCSSHLPGCGHLFLHVQVPAPMFPLISSRSSHLSQNMTFEALGHPCVVRSDLVPFLFPLPAGPLWTSGYKLCLVGGVGLLLPSPLPLLCKITCLCLLFLFIVSLLLCVTGCPCDIKVFAMFVYLLSLLLCLKTKWLS